jgi:hypothetical protein
MQDIIIESVTVNQLSSVARKILEAYPDERVFAFVGDLGAG